MCGIVGYIGKHAAAPVILEGLSRLEYRGYDSAGMAVFDGERIQIKKSVGRLKVLEELTHGGATMPEISESAIRGGRRTGRPAMPIRTPTTMRRRPLRSSTTESSRIICH